MKQTHDKREVFLITKHGKPIAKLVPVDQQPDLEIMNVFGKLGQCTLIKGDIMEPIDIIWDVVDDDQN